MLIFRIIPLFATFSVWANAAPIVTNPSSGRDAYANEHSVIARGRDLMKQVETKFVAARGQVGGLTSEKDIDRRQTGDLGILGIALGDLPVAVNVRTVAMMPDSIEGRAKEKNILAEFQDTVGQFNDKMHGTFQIRGEASDPIDPAGGILTPAGNVVEILSDATLGLKDGLATEKPVKSVAEAVGGIISGGRGGVSDAPGNSAVGVGNGIL